MAGCPDWKPWLTDPIGKDEPCASSERLGLSMSALIALRHRGAYRLEERRLGRPKMEQQQRAQYGTRSSFNANEYRKVAGARHNTTLPLSRTIKTTPPITRTI